MEFKMNRAFLIDTLKRQGICASVIGTADGLRYEYITPDGLGVSHGEIKSWPALKLRGLGDEHWSDVRAKLQSGSLTHDDLKGTELFYLHEDVTKGDSADAVEFFKGLLALPDSMELDIYFLCDMSDPKAVPSFFNDEESFLKAFAAAYCKGAIGWDELDDEYMEDVVQRLDVDFGEFQYLSYS